ncbi:dna polymerase subunit cdc27 [Ophiostoma piceae UAMH 11346]|uniref:DNA polymerase delta subunit 3 n=1 Tax=Ophiostoma piceae (strain UAMH 11346) TaxID=1262450 RepID=S3DB39_OPHP1|nr:dna polymerase subunit cdc27 [Ophiostoma piceae UAMH 11346]
MTRGGISTRISRASTSSPATDTATYIALLFGMAEINEFLATEVLVEQKLITYRYLSRALKLNVNVAKKALFDFHTSQNAKKAGSLHATYLLYGTKPEVELGQPKTATAVKAEEEKNGGDEQDVDMDDEVPYYLQSDQVPSAVITLVSEANLEAALAKYETLEAIHVYSISPEPTTDLQLLADSARQLRELRAAVNPEEAPVSFGTIANSHVRRRQRKGQPPILAPPPTTAATPASVFGAKTAKSAPIKEDANAKTASKPASPTDAPGPKSIWNKVAAKPAAAASTPTSEASSAAASPAPPASVANGKKPAAPAPAKKAAGGIMQAFAKGATMPKPKKKEEPKKAPAEEDTAMALSDDGGDDDGDDDILPKAQQVTGGKSREERMQALRKMMEDDEDEDEDDEDVLGGKNEDDREDTPMEDIEEPAPEPAVAAPVKEAGPSEIISASSGGGRRRGKKRVMKKKMIEDENGYLVTIQEEGWESFSEDEAPPPKAAPAPAASAPSSQAKPKKAPPKKGQGNIMSFFGKK